MGDAWFASVQTAIQVSEFGHFIGPVKCSHSLYPKKWIRDTMDKWPGGSYIVLESNIEGVDLLAIGYKYNKTDILYFIATRGAGHT